MSIPKGVPAERISRYQLRLSGQFTYDVTKRALESVGWKYMFGEADLVD